MGEVGAVVGPAGGDRERLFVGAVGRAVGDLEEGADAAQALEFGGGRGELVGVDEQLGRRVVDDELELGDREAPVEQHRHRTGASARELHVEELDAVVGEHGDPVAPFDAERSEVGGHRVDAGVEVAVGEAAAGGDLAHRFGVGSVFDVRRDPVIGRHRPVAGRARGNLGHLFPSDWWCPADLSTR